MVPPAPMQPLRRSNLLLVLLVITPIALLTWLGTYLIRDAARSTDTAREAVLNERLNVADHQMIHDLRYFTDQLDNLASLPDSTASAMAEALGRHPWVEETWISGMDGAVVPVGNKRPGTQQTDAAAAPRSKAIREALNSGRISGPPTTLVTAAFMPLPTVSPEVVNRDHRATWQTVVKTYGYHLATPQPQAAPPRHASGWHVTDGDFIYWRLAAGTLVCARMDAPALRSALFARLPLPGQEAYLGRLTLDTVTGIPLHRWGRGMPGSEGGAVSIRACSPPLSQWRVSYTPSSTEFPKPYLFPILLGVGSGCVLVLALAWTFFRENAREIRLAQQRVSFVNQISHELKTPLTNIRLYAEMASHRLEEDGDLIARRHLRVVETETGRLNRLIQNVLNYARQQRDKLSIQTRPVFLDEVITRAVNNWRPLLEGKGFSVELRLEGPAAMMADADALEQILGNLLSNVDKYAAYGKWVAVRTEQSGSAARLIVEDRGPGIPAGKRGLVFEPFERLRSDLNEGVSGTGIGLTISRELAELHGGTLEVCGIYREGARFILTLPLQPL